MRRWSHGDQYVPWRQVHARFPNGTELTRYDRQGKWFIETINAHRDQVLLSDAIRLGRRCREEGGEIFYGLPGGQEFDKAVRG
jgi:hypothetical protein